MTKAEYNDDAISVLKGLEPVRKRPGMYIGSTGEDGLHHLVWEIMDNSIDEAMAGYGEEINVILHKDQSVTIEDFGRGLPVGLKDGQSTVEIIFTSLHAGGKFGQEGGYKTSGGLHGVGTSVVNALSSKVIVEVYRDGYYHMVEFQNGGNIVKPFKKIKKSNRKTGTIVTFHPDPEIFPVIKFKPDKIKERLKESAFLNTGVTIHFIDETKDKKEKTTFKSDNGINDFVAELNKQLMPTGINFYASGEANDIEVEFAIHYNEGFSEKILSFVNNVKTTSGGTHETGVKAVITKKFNDFAKKEKILKGKDKNFTGDEIREGSVSIVSVKVPENLLEFEGQTKAKLGTPIARQSVTKVVGDELDKFFRDNPQKAKTILEKAIGARKVKEAARVARDKARKPKDKKKKAEVSLSGKLASASKKDPKKNELYLVEGDSAGGSAKQGRDRTFQAILPLRGKVINTEKAKLENILKNEEINTMIHTIGAGFGIDFDIEDCDYNKIIIMTDADVDGSHIQTLLLTFFYRYMRPLIENGKIYVAMPPLYKLQVGSGANPIVHYTWSDEELAELSAKLPARRKKQVQRFKGLGEMNADQLWETTMDPKTRTLIQVTIEDAIQADLMVETLMGEKVIPRRLWIEENVVFNLEDGAI